MNNTAELLRAIQSLSERLVRLETRLVRLAAHLGLDANGNPHPTHSLTKGKQ